MAKTPYDTDLDRNPANFQPLTPLGFLERAAAVFPDHTAIIHGRCGALTPSSTRARGGSPRRWPSAASSAATPSSVMLANTPAMLECHYGVPMTQARAQHAQHAARRADHRLLARPCRGQGRDHRPRIFQGDEGGARARQGEAAGDRLRRSGISPARASGWARSNTRTSSRKAIPISPGRCRTTNGTRSRSITPSAPPAIPRAWSITTAARICWRSATSSPAAWPSIRSICGRCRCSTATAGAFRGRSRSPPARMSACARCARRRCTTRSPATR